MIQGAWIGWKLRRRLASVKVSSRKGSSLVAVGVLGVDGHARLRDYPNVKTTRKTPISTYAVNGSSNLH